MDSIYSITFPVRWADADPNWHMTHSAFFEYAAHVRMSFLTENGYPPQKFMDMGFGPILLREEIKYLREIMMQEEVTVTLQLAAIKGSGRRWSMRHQFLRDGKLSAELTVDGTWLDFKTRRSMTPPPELLALLDKMSKTDDFNLEE